MNKTLFPKDIIGEHLSQHIVPDDLTERVINSNCTTFQRLIDHYDRVLFLSESNAVYEGLYSLKGPSFENLFRAYEPYYKNQEDCDKKLELLRREQSIHLLANFSSTQDVSGHLRLVEDFCDREEICELMILLSKKHTKWSKGFSEGYVKWLHFMIPYYQHLQAISFDFLRLLSIDFFPYQLIKTNVIQLKSCLEKLHLDVKLQEENFGDLNYILEIIELWKKLFLEKSSENDTQFYFALGMLSFMTWLLRFYLKKDPTFIKTCLFTSLYGDMFNEFRKRSPSEAFSLTTIPEAKINTSDYKEILKSLCLDLKNDNQTSSDKKTNLQILECLLCVVEKRKELQQIFVCSNKTLDPLYLDILEVVALSKDIYSMRSFYSGIYMDSFEYAFMSLLAVLSQIQEKISKQCKNYLKMWERLPLLFQDNIFTQLTCDYYFETLRHFTESNNDRYNSVLNNWNLLEISLQNMIEPDNICQIQKISMNLKHTLQLLKFKAGTRNLLENGNELELLSIFKLYINKISQNIEEESELEKLKKIGIFLTGVLTLDLDEIKDTRFQFLSSLINFFIKKCKPSHWDIFSIQLDFWTSLRGTMNFQQIVSDKPFLDFLILIEDRVAIGQFNAASFTNPNQLNKIPKVKQKIYEIIAFSLETIETNLSQLSNSLDWNNPQLEKEQEKIDMMRILHRRFIYFTHVWIECFIKVVKLHVTSDTKELSRILQKTATLYFHPAWRLFPQEAELKIQKECYSTLILYTRDIRWQAYQAFYQAIHHILITLTTKVLLKDKNKEDTVLEALSVELTTSSNITDNIDLDTFISRLSELESIFEPAEEFKLGVQLEETMTVNFKSILKLLFELASSYLSLKGNEEQDQNQKMMKNITSALKSIMRPVEKMKKFQEILSTFLSDLLNSCIGEAQSEYHENVFTFFANVALCLDKTVRVKVCRALFIQNKIWTFVMMQLTELSKSKARECVITKHSKPLGDLITILYEGLKTEVQIEQTRKIVKSSNEGGSKDLITDMYLELASQLENFPFFDMIFQSNGPLLQAFKLILQIFESLYIYMVNECDKLEKSMLDLTNNGAAEAKEVSDSLEEFKQNITNKFYLNIQPFQPLYNFEIVKDIKNNKIESTRSLCFNMLLNSLISFSIEILTGLFPNSEKGINVLPQILKMHAYMNLITNLLKQFALKPILGYSAILTIFNSSKILFEQFKKQDWSVIKKDIDFDIFLSKLQNMLKYMSKILLDHCVSVCEQQNNLKNLTDLILGWIVLIFETHQFIRENHDFDIIVPKDAFLKDITTLLHLFVSGEDSVSSILLLMNAIFSIQKREPWKMATIATFAFVLETKLEKSLSDSVEFEINVKKTLMNSPTWPNPLKLIDFTNSPYIKGKEQGPITPLVDVLMSKFRIFSCNENAQLDNSLFNANLFISIDGSQEADSAIFSIDYLLNNLSSNSIAIMELLMNSLVDNFLTNMSHISSTRENSAQSDIIYKETSSILTILSMILHKNRHLVCYVAFKKHDYRPIIKKYKEENNVAISGDIEDFAMLTFVEFLFRIRYFAYNNGDFYQFLMSLIGLTGITFSGLEKTLIVLDASVIVINEVLRLTCRQIKAVCQEDKDFLRLLENFVRVQSCISMFGFLWHHVRATYKKDVFERCFQEEFSHGLKLILLSIRDFTREYSHIPAIYGSLISSLPNQLKRHYDKELSYVSLSDGTLQQLKNENYLQFLQEYETMKDTEELGFISESAQLNTYMCNRISAQSSVDIGLNYNQLSGSGIGNARILNLPLTSGYYWGSGPSWKSERTAIILATKDFCSYYKAFGFAADGNQRMIHILSDNFLSYLDWNELGLADYTQEKWSLSDLIPKDCTLKLNISASAPQTGEVIVGKTCLDLVSQILRSKIIEEEQKRDGDIIEIATSDQISPTLKVEKAAEMDIKPPIKDAKIHSKQEQKIQHFMNLDLKGKAEFEFLERQVIQGLKELSERMLVDFLSLEQDISASKDIIKKIVTSKLTEQLDALPSFLKNLYICLIDQFEVLRLFEYPCDYNEIKQEFNWIQNNFSEYLNILNTLRVSLKLPALSFADKSTEINNSGLLSMGNFVFCSDYGISSSQTTSITVSSVPDNVIKLVKNLFFIDDEVVESLICCLYSSYKGSFSQSPVMQLIKELGNSVLFEAKLFDFCFFFLYCPEYIELINAKTQKSPEDTLMKQQDFEITSCQYNEVALNILTFLSEYHLRRELLIEQPRVYLEQSSLASLKGPKIELRYFEKTRQMISVFDLIVGLSDVKEIIENPKLREILINLILRIFSKSRQFEIQETKIGDEMTELKKVCTAKSCMRLLRLNKVESVLKNMMDFIPYGIDVIIKTIQRIQNILSTQVVEILSLIQTYNADFPKVNQLGPEVLAMEEYISLLSRSISTRFIEHYSPTQSDANEKKIALFHENFRLIHKEMFKNEEAGVFFNNVFELTSVLSNFKNQLTPQAKSVLLDLVKICVHYYALACIQGEIVQPDFLLIKESPEEANLLVFDYSAFDGAIQKKAEFEKFTDAYDETLKLRRGHLDGLFAKIYKMNEDFFSKALTQDSNPSSLLKGFQIISKKHSWMHGGFDSKKKNLMTKLDNDGKEKGYASTTRTISVDRMNLVKSALNAFANQPLTVIRQKIRVVFSDEKGNDAGGLTREWLTIITRELFNPKFGLFQLAEDNLSLQPSTLAKVIPSHLKYLQLAGMMLAKAIQLGCLTDVTLTNPFLNHILRKNITLNDLNDIDASLTKSLKWILTNPVGVLDHLFTYEMEFFGKRITRELIPDGYSTSITEANKREFVLKVCEAKLYGNIKEEIEAFKQGFYLIIPAPYMFELSAEELQLLISGPSKIDVNEIKNHAEFNGLAKNSPLVQWLWEVLFEFSQEELSAFVLFVSGSPKLPYGGLQNRPIRFRNASVGPNSLPISHTCSWAIELPAYRSKEELKQKLLLAITEGQGSFMIA